MHRRLFWNAVLMAALLAAAETIGAAAQTADQHPDLTGYWSANPPVAGGGGGGAVAQAQDPGELDEIVNVPTYRNGSLINLTGDNEPRARVGNNLPLYKPEYWEKVLDNDLHGNQRDPIYGCLPQGQPRLGPPARIVQTPTDFVFLYAPSIPTTMLNQYLAIPIGPRRFPVDRDGSWIGDPVAHWEGDTLVVETEGYNDATWWGDTGYFHSYDQKVTERFRPDGKDKLMYEVTVDDPGVLQKPYVLNPRPMYRNTSPNARMVQAPACIEHDQGATVGRARG